MSKTISKLVARDTYKWIVWMIAAGAFLIVFFHRYSLGVISDDLSSELDLTGTQLSNLVSMYYYMYAILQIPFGILADTIGPRKITSVGMLLAAAGSFMFALGSNLFVLYIGRLLVAVGVSGILICILKLQTLWFKPQEFATVLGITSLVGNSGGILATTPFALLVLEIGWRSSFGVIGISSLVVAVLLWIIVRDRPEHMGYAPVVDVSEDKESNIDIKQGLKVVLKNKNTWLAFFMLFGSVGAIMSFSGVWGVQYLIHVYGMSTDAAATQIMIFTIGVLIGSPFMGKITDKINNRKLVMQVGSFVFALMWVYKIIVMGSLPPQSHLPVMYFIAGFFGIFMMLSHALVKESNPLKYSGTAVSVINIAPFIGTSVLNFVIGAVLDLTWTGSLENGRIYELVSYQYAFIVYLFFAVLAFILSFFINEPTTEKSD